jgi:hypothetical protein
LATRQLGYTPAWLHASQGVVARWDGSEHTPPTIVIEGVKELVELVQEASA